MIATQGLTTSASEGTLPTVLGILARAPIWSSAPALAFELRPNQKQALTILTRWI